MKKKKDNVEIEVVVFNYFVRALKSDGKYMIFRQGVNNTGIMKFLVKKAHTHDSPFSSLSTTKEIVETLRKITDDMARNNGNSNGVYGMDKYEHVTMTINHLLHFFLESYGLPMDKLCSLGEEIYNYSCHKLFGDTMEDLETQKAENINKVNSEAELMAKLFHNFVNERNSGKISKDVTFDMYAKKHQNEFIKLNLPTEHDDVGHILGRGPEDIEDFRRPRWLDDNE